MGIALCTAESCIASYKTASGNQAYNRSFENETNWSGNVTKPQAVIRPTTGCTFEEIEYFAELQNRKR